jgi:hypothetical protein
MATDEARAGGEPYLFQLVGGGGQDVCGEGRGSGDERGARSGRHGAAGDREAGRGQCGGRRGGEAAGGLLQPARGGVGQQLVRVEQRQQAVVRRLGARGRCAGVARGGHSLPGVAFFVVVHEVPEKTRVNCGFHRVCVWLFYPKRCC